MTPSKDTSDMPDMTEDILDCEYPDPKDLSPAQHELSEIMLKRRDDPTLMGIRMLGKDGIFRSLDADRNVVDAVAFTPQLIKALMDRMPYDAEAERIFRGVNGTKTPKEQWYKPLPDILPPPLEEEHRERSEEPAGNATVLALGYDAMMYKMAKYKGLLAERNDMMAANCPSQHTRYGTINKREYRIWCSRHYDVEGFKEEHKNIYTLAACADLCTRRAWCNHALHGQFWTVCHLYETTKVGHTVTPGVVSHEWNAAIKK
ncbi:hypothetical protein CDV31_006577 [Fusarium ambrosium]|uniref:Uncharacterized protein n=1 Tax=Fusarium ambrosium TaxID=131363 RepID=A0A428UBZ8_9HYPO|nr:hypothetical protein CDV31_006577 [Fusarium ambrosium]